MIISPSMLSADFNRLGEELKTIENSGAEMLHIDVMDGHFVPNISFGIPVVASIRKTTNLFFDVHLMIQEPERYIEEFRKAGADLITFHLEADGDPAVLIEKIHALGCKAGLSVKPKTNVELIKPYLKDLDLVLVMTVEPGFGGQSFMEDMMPKLVWLKEECKRIHREDILIQVDGGINSRTIATAAKSGANCFVAGSAIFGKPDYKEEVETLRNLAIGAV